jgi:DNA polymerase V
MALVTLSIATAAANLRALPLTHYTAKVRCGQSRFPSAAQDYEQTELDLNQRFITNPPATFFVTAVGDSMVGVGIHPGSTLIVNKAIKPKSSNIVIALVDGELVVKRLYKRGGVVKLLSEPETAHPPIVMQEGQELIIWGVVTHAITPTV